MLLPYAGAKVWFPHCLDPVTERTFSQYGRVVSAERHSGLLAYRVATDDGGELPLTEEELMESLWESTP